MRPVPWLERLYLDLPIARPRSGSLCAYALATAAVAAATLLRLSLDPWISGIQFITYFPAVMLATFYCGVEAGIAAAVLSLLAAWYFILPPRFSFELGTVADTADLVLFASVMTVAMAVVAVLRGALLRLREQCALDAAIFDASPDAIILADREGLIVAVNEPTLPMFGQPREALIGQPIEVLLPKRFRQRHAAYIAAFAAVPRGRSMGSGLALLGVRADGSEFPIDVQIGAIEGQGEIRMIATVRDITQQKAAAAALAESERARAVLEERQRGAEQLHQSNEKLAKIIASAPTAIFAIDRDDRVTMWNPAAEQIYGLAAAEVVGRSWREIAVGLVPPDSLAREELYRAALAEGGLQDVEVQRLAPDGTLRELSVSAAVLRDGGERVAGVLFIARDIGQAKEMERRLLQAQRVEAIGQLTGGVAHDFNNLLAIIHGNLELLEEMAFPDPSARDLVTDALAAARRGASLTHRLLAYARRQQLTPIPTDLGSLLAGFAGMLRRLVEESIEIVIQVEPGLQLCRVDPQQLENALLNLVLNARDAMEGGGTLSIEARNAVLDEEDCRRTDVVPGRYVQLAITDTGAGMPKEVLDRAVEPFFTTKPVGRGTGLGLSMVYGFVKQSGGQIALSSEPGAGTTVHIHLPAFGSADEVEMPDGGERAAPVASQAQAVLVVEDDASVRRLQVRILASLGYRTLEAADGPSALAALDRAGRADLLLSDVVLPGGMSGPALAEAARRRCPGLKVILMSGYAPGIDEAGQNAEAAPILMKPFSRSTLARAVQEALETSPISA